LRGQFPRHRIHVHARTKLIDLHKTQSEAILPNIALPATLPKLPVQLYPKYPARFHDRMPVVLADADAPAWLGDEPLPDDRLRTLCRGLPAEALLHETLPPKLKVTRKSVTKPSEDDQPTLL